MTSSLAWSIPKRKVPGGFISWRHRLKEALGEFIGGVRSYSHPYGLVTCNPCRLLNTFAAPLEEAFEILLPSHLHRRIALKIMLLHNFLAIQLHEGHPLLTHVTFSLLGSMSLSLPLTPAANGLRPSWLWESKVQNEWCGSATKQKQSGWRLGLYPTQKALQYDLAKFKRLAIPGTWSIFTHSQLTHPIFSRSSKPS